MRKLGEKLQSTYLRMRIEHRKVADNNRNGQRNGQYTSERTQGPNEHTDIGLWCHITISHGSHRNNGPP